MSSIKATVVKFVVTAAVAVSLIAIGASSASSQVATIDIGSTVHDGIVGVHFGASWSGYSGKERHGGYLALEYGARGHGKDDFMYVSLGKTFSNRANLFQFRLGSTLGGYSRGNTVTNLTAYGLGYVVGTNGSDYFVAGLDAGLRVPIGSNTAIVTTYTHTHKNQSIFRFGFSFNP